MVGKRNLQMRELWLALHHRYFPISSQNVCPAIPKPGMSPKTVAYMIWGIAILSFLLILMVIR
jgi:hypothetical protein